MQINSIQNTPSFGIKVQKNLERSIRKQAQGTLIGDNAEEIVEHLKKIGSDATRLKRITIHSLPTAPGSKEPFFQWIFIKLKTGVPFDKRNIFKNRSFELFPPRNIDEVNTALTELVDNAERYYISRKALDDIGKNFSQEGLDDSIRKIYGYYGSSQGGYIGTIKKLLSGCFPKFQHQ